MVTIAARLVLTAIGMVAGAASRTDTVPATRPELSVRVALVTGAREAVIGPGTRFAVFDGRGRRLAKVEADIAIELRSTGSGIRTNLDSAVAGPVDSLYLRPISSDQFLRVNGHYYRGELLVASAGKDLVVIDILPVEEYLPSVVSAELGVRPSSDRAAVFAQAVASRTVALQAIKRRGKKRYDLVATFADQLYRGIESETPMAWDAVKATRGEVLVYHDQVIEAFFHSTCGGRTASAEEVFRKPLPYLQSVPDRDHNGQVYCADSPRFQWREEWRGSRLADALAKLVTRAGRRPNASGSVDDLGVDQRSLSGRATRLVLSTGSGLLSVSGQQAIRQAFRLEDGTMLRSTKISFQVTKSGGRVAQLTAEGAGSGHGVGMCQWGAIGRAREGESYREILAAYYPGTRIRRLY